MRMIKISSCKVLRAKISQDRYLRSPLEKDLGLSGTKAQREVIGTKKLTFTKTSTKKW